MSVDDTNDEEFAQSTLSDAVENQIRDGNPSEAKATLNRLLLAGYAREETIAMMASVLAQEVRASVEEDRAFNLDGYIAALRALPALPHESK